MRYFWITIFLLFFKKDKKKELLEKRKSLSNDYYEHLSVPYIIKEYKKTLIELKEHPSLKSELQEKYDILKGKLVAFQKILNLESEEIDLELIEEN